MLDRKRNADGALRAGVLDRPLETQSKRQKERNA